jgi:hypothetical protein
MDPRLHTHLIILNVIFVYLQDKINSGVGAEDKSAGLCFLSPLIVNPQILSWPLLFAYLRLAELISERPSLLINNLVLM